MASALGVLSTTEQKFTCVAMDDESCVLRLEEVIMDLGFVEVEFGEAPCQCVVKPSTTITVCFFVQIAAKLGGHIIRGKGRGCKHHRGAMSLDAIFEASRQQRA
jgi:hypothetical protein